MREPILKKVLRKLKANLGKQISVTNIYGLEIEGYLMYADNEATIIRPIDVATKDTSHYQVILTNTITDIDTTF